MNRVRWVGDSIDRVRDFPEDVRGEVGHQLWQVELGGDPDDWKPMPSIGPGVREIRIRETSGAFRVIYVTTIDELIYVLHAFQKKSQATPQRDIDLARRRLREVRR